MIDNFDQRVIKNLNRSRILRAFRENEIIQKKDLVDELGLSITTVTTNTRALLDEGLIEEMGIAESTGGRKPVVFKFLKNARVALGVDISPHLVTLVLTNLASETLETRTFLMESSNLDDVLDRAWTTALDMLESNGFGVSTCLGMGISLPGVVDDVLKVLINAPNLDVHHFDFAAFEARLGMPVFIENEANVSAFAELIMGAAMKLDHAVFVSITDGVGCGIIANHKVSKGTFNKAGEFGHMRISDKEIRCSCGRTGCWEIFSSERALYRNFNALSGEMVTDLATFFKRYEAGNLLAQNALDQYLKALFIGVENIVLGLDPEVIIIGGGIAKYLQSAVPHLNAYAEINQPNAFSSENKVVLSTLEPQSAVVGSSLLPLRELFGY